jgi:hypothetical protein
VPENVSAAPDLARQSIDKRTKQMLSTDRSLLHADWPKTRLSVVVVGVK